MSGALPDEVADQPMPNNLEEIITAPPNHNRVSYPDRIHTGLQQLSFDSTFNASDILHASAPRASLEVCSTRGMHTLSHCVTPMVSRPGSAVNLFSMRGQSYTINDVLAASGRLTAFNDRSSAQSNASLAATLPTEILQSIYWYLGPFDFNAARHTCSNWMNASLSLQLLAEQLKRGGWWSDAATRTQLFQEWRKAWPMSCHLARECAFGGSWTGNGLDHDCSSRVHDPMTESSSVDFSNVKQKFDGDSLITKSDFKVCTTSVCRKYYLAASGLQLYTFEVDGNAIRLLSKTTYERDIVAASIDVSIDHFAIAVLLQGRIGVYLEMSGKLNKDSAESQWESAGTISNSTPAEGAVMDFATSDGSQEAPIDLEVRTLDELSANAGSIGENSVLHHSVETVTTRTWAGYLGGRRARMRGIRRMPVSVNGVWPYGLHFNDKGSKGGTSARQRLPQIVYRNICTDEDPPISIAISPTRQCVAYGCKAGVELYWVDLTTGQHLNRYFPLARPSDHLYFLPPRSNIDGHTRLRLISTSNYKEAEGEVIAQRALDQSPQSSFWFSLSSSWHFPLARNARQQANSTEHSYAVPLSDGHHILFTENGSGLACLGSDRPTGSLQRLSRKFIFIPPVTPHSDGTPLIPTVYSAADNLSNGARIVVGYGEAIALYSVPVDALRYSRAEQEHTLQDPAVSFEDLEHINILPHPVSNAQAVREALPGDASMAGLEQLNMRWAHYLPAASRRLASSMDDLWPLNVSGTYVGSLQSLKSLSVQETENGPIIWAFSTAGVARSWRVDGGFRPT